MLRCKECKGLLGEAVRLRTGEWAYNCPRRGVPQFDAKGKVTGMTVDHADHWYRVNSRGYLERIRLVELQGTSPREYVGERYTVGDEVGVGVGAG